MLTLFILILIIATPLALMIPSAVLVALLRWVWRNKEMVLLGAALLVLTLLGRKFLKRHKDKLLELLDGGDDDD